MDPSKIETDWRWVNHTFTRYAIESIPKHAAEAGLLHQDLDLKEREVWVQLYRRWPAVYIVLERRWELEPAEILFNDLLINAGILRNNEEAAQEFDCAIKLHLAQCAEHAGRLAEVRRPP